MAHGAGGKASRRLVEGLFAPLFGGSLLETLGDAAVVDIDGTRLALTADSFVVRPLRFPGGSIGELAVNGTVNDLAVSGAAPVALLVTFVLEAGVRGQAVEAEARAMAAAAQRAGVAVVGGDTKVVEHGKADGMYITTAGIGRVDPRVRCSPTLVRPGDKILLSGHVGNHGITILLARGEIDLEADVRSDTRPLWPLIGALIEVAAPGLRWMRDPTRGGVATSLNELARDCGLAPVLFEDRVPVRDAVRGACELLGLDPLHIANEGQFLAVVAPEHADAALAAVRAAPGGDNAVIVGEIREQPARTLLAVGGYGGSRVVDMLVGDPLPRIC
jgi:hydrogenase expression/formation protein HypE